jgi:hypothetical protein
MTAIIEGDQHFKGNASHVLDACCLVLVTLVLKIVNTGLVKLTQFSIDQNLAVNPSNGRVLSQ